MMRLIPFALVLGLAACPAKPEDGFGPGKDPVNHGTVGNKPPTPMPVDKPDFDHAVELAPAFDKATGKLTVTLKIKPGYHAYAKGEEVGKPVELGVDAPCVADNITIPAGTMHDLGPDLGKSIILEGDVPLTAMVKCAGDIKGVVNAQVCTDKACDRPKPHPFTVPTA